MGERRRGTKTVSRERAVLIACIEAGLGATERLLRELNGFDRWVELSETALREGMAPLLYRALSEHCPEATPSGVLGELRALYLANAQRALRMSAQLLVILDLLDDHGIAALPFKGPLLAEQVYGDPASRQMADLDILLREKDVSRAHRALVDAGFDDLGTDLPNPRWARADCECALFHRDGSLLLELHWRTGPRFARASFAAEDLLPRAQPARLLGRRVMSLHPEDTFFVLCTHGSTHGWDRLEGLATLAAFVHQHRDWRWREVLERAGDRHCLYRCLTALALLAAYGADDLPLDLKTALARHPRSLRLAAEIKNADEEPQLATLRGALRSMSWQARCLDTPSEMAVHLISRIVTPGTRDWQWVSLPPGLAPLYYVLRPIRVAWRSLRKMRDDARRRRLG